MINSQSLFPRRILVMDDVRNGETMFQDLFKSPILYERYRLAGYARDKREALLCHADYSPQAALLDLRGATARDGVDTALALRETDRSLKIVIMSQTDTMNTEIACEAVYNGFEYVEKEHLLNAHKARLCFDLLFEGLNLPLPRAIQAELARRYFAPQSVRSSPDRQLIRKREEWVPPRSQLQLGISFRDEPSLSEIERASILKLEPETMRRYDNRLRHKLRELGFSIAEDYSGRQAIVQALQELGHL